MTADTRPRTARVVALVVAVLLLVALGVFAAWRTYIWSDCRDLVADGYTYMADGSTVACSWWSGTVSAG